MLSGAQSDLGRPDPGSVTVAEGKFLSSSQWWLPVEPLRELARLLRARGYPRTVSLPLPGSFADVCLDPVNAVRTVTGRSNAFHRSAAWRLHAVGLSRETIDLYRLFMLGYGTGGERAEALLGAGLTGQLLDVRVLEQVGDRVRSTVVIAPFRGQLLLADAFRLQDDPEYCYLGRSSFTVPEFLSSAAPASSRPAARVLDLGCGSGAGAIAYAGSYDASRAGSGGGSGSGSDGVVGTDVVERCLRFARLNAALNGVSVDFHRSDVFSDVEGTFDLVIANTPCVWAAAEPSAPRTYASGGSDFGLELPGRMISGALDRLRPSGRVLAVISAPVVDGRQYAIAALGQICGDRPVRVVLYPLLEESELTNLALYRRHRVSTVVRYLAELQFDDQQVVMIGRHDRARLWSYRMRALPVRALARAGSRDRG